LPSDDLAAASSPQDSADPEQALSEELTWLTKEVAEPLISLRDAIYTVQALVQPLAQQWRTPLEIVVPPALADLQVPPLALRSILLTLLSVVIPISGRAPVKIMAAQSGPNLELSISCPNPDTQLPPLTPKDDARLQTAQNLADFYGSRLTFPNEEPGFWARLVLPSPEQVPVLVIDDNADWIDLQQRYAAGSRYQITGMRDPSNAPLVAQKLQPALIFLDVMMHNVDGWQILSELRHTPATTDIPVVVCSILPVEELALSLGANAFLQKPVTRHQFLKMLDFQIMRQS
jgi:CheY-like chemotaxis protein